MSLYRIIEAAREDEIGGTISRNEESSAYTLRDSDGNTLGGLGFSLMETTNEGKLRMYHTEKEEGYILEKIQTSMEINVSIKFIYGRQLIYPINHLEVLALTRTKTLDKDHIEALKKLGFSFRVITDEPVTI
jgi:hypothetical protein